VKCDSVEKRRTSGETIHSTESIYRGYVFSNADVLYSLQYACSTRFSLRTCVAINKRSISLAWRDTDRPHKSSRACSCVGRYVLRALANLNTLLRRFFSVLQSTFTFYSLHCYIYGTNSLQKQQTTNLRVWDCPKITRWWNAVKYSRERMESHQSVQSK